MKAIVFIFTLNLFFHRDELGNFRANAIEDAVVDLEEVLRATAGVTKASERDAPVALNCRVTALLKIVHVLSQTKVQMGLQPTDEEVGRVTACIQEAKSLAPGNESVLLLEADLMSINGETDSALAKCDEVILLSDGSDSIPYVIKANVLMQKVLASETTGLVSFSSCCVYICTGSAASIDGTGPGQPGDAPDGTDHDEGTNFPFFKFLYSQFFRIDHLISPGICRRWRASSRRQSRSSRTDWRPSRSMHS
jgi:hypothetical protein